MPSTKILKIDSAQQIVYGWANIVVKDGTTVVDLQDDTIDPEDLEKASTDFMLESRASGVMHKGGAVGDVVASLVTTPEIRKAFDLGDGPVGWIYGVKIQDPDVFKRVVSGELSMFSIQGHSQRVVEDNDAAQAS